MTMLRVLPSPAEPTTSARANISIYRPFFLAGIFTVLTAGCLLGAVALAGIALKGSYTASVWTPYVLAHANSQLFGWVGFFIMGFALQQHAPSVARSKIFHRLAYASLGLMGAGIALRFAAEPLARVDRGTWVPVGVFACLLQWVAVVFFLYNSGANRHRTGKGLTWQTAFVFSSLFWLLVAASVEPFVFAMTHQASEPASIAFVAKWFAPYREVQFLGFVAMMIFGVSLTKFSTCFGFRAALPSWGLAGLGLWTMGLLARTIGWLVYIDSGLDWNQGSWFRAGGILLALGAACVAVSLGVFERFSQAYRSQKFIRAAFGWLLAAGVLLAFEPFHLIAIGSPFSHAYTGAIRHAVTVGFISQMIVGVGLHVVSRMNGVDDHRLPTLWSVFWLLNLGNAARVSLEVATDYTPMAFAPMGVTGFIELTGLAIWAFTMVRMMVGRRSTNVAYTC